MGPIFFLISSSHLFAGLPFHLLLYRGIQLSGIHSHFPVTGNPKGIVVAKSGILVLKQDFRFYRRRVEQEILEDKGKEVTEAFLSSQIRTEYLHIKPKLGAVSVYQYLIGKSVSYVNILNTIGLPSEVPFEQKLPDLDSDFLCL